MKSGNKKRKSSSGNKTKSPHPSSKQATEQKSESKLEKLKRREAQIKAQIKQEEAKYRAKERKARAKQLFELGTIMEKSFNLELQTAEDRDLLMQILTEKHCEENGHAWSYSDLIMEEFRQKRHVDNLETK